MAVIITDTRVVISESDATTGWTASDGVSVFTSAPSPVEASGSLGQQVSNALESAYVTITSADLSDTLVYCWLLPGGVLDDNIGTSSGDAGIQIYLGDGTNDRGYAVGGSNEAAFRHNDGPVLWQCFALDTSNLPTTFTNFVGAGAPTLTTITRIGNAFRTLVKSVGGVENCFMDILYYGNGGLIITGGGTGTEGKFSEIALRDRSETDHPGQNVASATGAAYGICRELGTSSFGLQGALTFGDAAGTGSVDFEDGGVSVLFEDRNFGTNKYGLTVTGNGTGTTSVIWGTRDGIGLGSGGIAFTCPTGAGAFFTATSANINTLGIYGCTFLNFDQGFTFTTDGTAGPNHEIFSSNFDGCSQITIGTTEFKNNDISGTTSTGTAEAAVLISSTTNTADLTFTSGGTGHAIEIADSANSPFTFTDFTFTGYAGTDGGTGNEVIVNTSGNPITINIIGGSGVPSVDTTNSTGTVTIVNNVSSTVTVVDADTTAIQGAVVAVYNSGDDTELANDETDVNGEINFSSSANIPVYIRVRKSTSGSTRFIPVETVGNTGLSGLSVTVTLTEDEIASA